MPTLATPARGDGKPKFVGSGPPKPAPNTGDWNAAKSAYQVLAAPAASWLLSSIPAAGPLTGAALGMQKLSSNSAADTFANTVIGEKDSRKVLREREARRAIGDM